MGQSPITTVLLIAIVGSSFYAWNNRDFFDLKYKLISRHLDVLMKTIPPGVERIAPA